MRQRSTVCTHQMFDLESESSESRLLPDYRFPENDSDYASRCPHPVVSAPGNTIDLLQQFRDYQERVIFYGNHFNVIQNFHPIANLGLGGLAPNFYNANIVLAPGRNVPVHQSNMIAEQLPSFFSQADNGINMDEFDRNNQIVNADTGFCKRKNFEVIPGFCYNSNGSASSSSSTSYHSNFALPLRGQSFESVPCSVDPTSRCPPQYGGRAPLIGAEEPRGSVRNRSVVGGFPEFSFVPQQNCLLPGSYMTDLFQPTNNAFASQMGNGNSIEDGSSTLNYNNNLRYLQGIYTNHGPLQMTNMNIPVYNDGSSGNNSAMLCHPSSMPNFHSPLQNMQVRSHGYPAHMPTSYQPLGNNLYSINANHSVNGLELGSTIQNFPTGADQIYRPRQLPQPIQQVSRVSARTISSEDASLMDLSELYEVGSIIDQHRDMRLDIDGMSYEELLVLEEQIGVVKTGLSEECIMERLKTRIYVSQETTSTPAEKAILSDNQTCTICQVEYEENETIGMLDCSHIYHAYCIEQWLLIKNLCPICKTTALAIKDLNIG